ncbi:unnamed protein product, partial [Didymodactylos carnosus]
STVHFIDKKALDTDLCIETGRNYSQNELIKTPKNGFVRLRWNPTEKTLKSKLCSNDQNNQRCIKGYKLKENMRNFIELNLEIFNTQRGETNPIQVTPEGEDVNAKFSPFFNLQPTSQSFNNTLTDVLNIQPQQQQNSERLLLYKKHFLIYYQIISDPRFLNISKKL